MKIMIISDIHGYSKNLKKVLDIYTNNNFDMMICLGDLLTPGYDYEEVKTLLNNFSRKYDFTCMMGNNDRYIDGLDFPLCEGYISLTIDGHRMFFTHGNRYNINNKSFMDREGDILIQGHTHSRWMYKEYTKYYLNPGSISLPRDDCDGSFIVYENNVFYLYDIDNNLESTLEVLK